MRRTVEKFAAIILYVVLILVGMGFDIGKIWDTKGFLFVVTGAGILSLPYLNDKGQMKRALGWNFLMTGYITAFLFLFGSLSGQQGEAFQFSIIVENCRPILYGLIFYIVLNPHEKAAELEKKDEALSESRSVEEAEKEPTKEEISADFRKKNLTGREVEIALLICEGKANKEIADELCISETTVKKHVSHIFEKLELTKREQIKDVGRI